MEYEILLPSKLKVISEKENFGTFEIEGLYPGYGHTLGNSLRRIILSSIPGAGITSIKIENIPHEFSTIKGIKEDVINIILNLKRVRFKMLTDEPQTVVLSVKGPKIVLAKDIKTPSQIEVLNGDLYLMEITGKTEINIEMTVEKGLGFVLKEELVKNKLEAGVIVTDVIFSPIRRVFYEVENMRIGEKTNYNKLIFSIETDGSITPQEVFNRAISIMISQLKAIIGLKEEGEEGEKIKKDEQKRKNESKEKEELEKELMKTRIENLKLSSRTLNALFEANIRTVGGLADKSFEELLKIEGIGEKGAKEIKKALQKLKIDLKE